ncbi:MAG: excinuclease ABC subunit UvrA, partial [Deltaproteobacteria bacterium]
LSAYARQFLRRLAKPDVESIEGLSPAIAIEKKGVTSNPRSTVGTVTEVHDYLRILFARCGTLWCPDCGIEVVSHSPQQMVERILKLPAGTRFALLAPVKRRPDQTPASVLKRLRRAGFLRVLLEGEVLDIEQLEENPRPFDTVDVYVDRLVARKGVRSRLADSLETALELGGGQVRVAVVDGEDLRLTSRHLCLQCGRSFPQPSPRLFSFNSPEGACPRCDGLGQIRQVDPGRIVRPELSLRQGAIDTGHGKTSPYQLQALEALSVQLGFSRTSPSAASPRRRNGSFCSVPANAPSNSSSPATK